MSSELERRLEGVFAEAPEPDPGAEEKALHRALRALQPDAPARRGLRTVVLAFAALVVLLVIAAGSLAAAGALHVSLGVKKPKPPPLARQLTLPQGANGVAAIVNHRLSVAIHGGFRLQDPASAAALSPHAYYVAAGIGTSLVALAPDGRIAWSHPASGKVVAIAWAPDGLRIAYVVHVGRRFVLRSIYGNGIHDKLIDRSVRPVRPSWRADNLAFAYVGGGGRAVIYDVGHESRQIVPVRAPVTGLAFAPSGDALALRDRNGVSLLHQSAYRHIAATTVEAFGWLDGRLAVATPALHSAVISLYAPTGASRGSSQVHGIVRAITPRAVVVQEGRSLVAGNTTLLTAPRDATVSAFEIGY